jgi:predicted DsbA family dithiol-disulfide isomerase
VTIIGAGRAETLTAIDVYADIWCPFAHVGLRAVVRRRTELGRGDVVVRVKAWPLELVNRRPQDPAMMAEHIRALRAQVASDVFTDFDPAHFPTSSLPALALAAAAYRRGDRSGEAVSLALRNALYEEGRDISDPAVLTDIASVHGVGPVTADDENAVLADWEEGKSRGVKGSPHFFCGEADMFCPSLDITKDSDGELHIRRNMHALDALLAECFKL